MGKLLTDEEANRIRGMLRHWDGDPNMAGWIQRLLEDRQERSSLILKLARGLYHARRRFRQAQDYLDGLLGDLQEDTRSPWPGKLPCVKCGASGAGLHTKGLGREVVHVVVHPDGQECEGGARVVMGDVPETDELGCPNKV